MLEGDCYHIQGRGSISGHSTFLQLNCVSFNYKLFEKKKKKVSVTKSYKCSSVISDRTFFAITTIVHRSPTIPTMVRELYLISETK